MLTVSWQVLCILAVVCLPFALVAGVALTKFWMLFQKMTRQDPEFMRLPRIPDTILDQTVRNWCKAGWRLVQVRETRTGIFELWLILEPGG